MGVHVRMCARMRAWGGGLTAFSGPQQKPYLNNDCKMLSRKVSYFSLQFLEHKPTLPLPFPSVASLLGVAMGMELSLLPSWFTYSGCIEYLWISLVAVGSRGPLSCPVLQVL